MRGLLPNRSCFLLLNCYSLAPFFIRKFSLVCKSSFFLLLPFVSPVLYTKRLLPHSCHFLLSTCPCLAAFSIKRVYFFTKAPSFSLLALLWPKFSIEKGMLPHKSRFVIFPCTPFDLFSFKKDLLLHTSYFLLIIFISILDLPFSGLIIHRKGLHFHKSSLLLPTCISLSLLSISLGLSPYRNNYLLLAHTHLSSFSVKNCSIKAHFCCILAFIWPLFSIE